MAPRKKVTATMNTKIKAKKHDIGAAADKAIARAKKPMGSTTTVGVKRATRAAAKVNAAKGKPVSKTKANADYNAMITKKATTRAKKIANATRKKAATKKK